LVQVVETAGGPVNLEGLSDGELLDLAVPSEPPTQGRRVLVIWLYLTESPKTSLKEFDHTITALAERELERRADSSKR
jgi:hypothetical protein